jgi:hypothetical protein
MPFVKFLCPTCSAVLKVDEGRARGGITCPGCATPLTVPWLRPPEPEPAPAPPPPKPVPVPAPRDEEPPPERRRARRSRRDRSDEDDWDDEDELPRRPRRVETAGQWVAVRAGLLLLILACAAVVAATALSLLGMAVLTGGGLKVADFLSKAMGVLLLAAFVLDFVGLILLAFTPPRYASRGMILGVIVITVLTYVVPVVAVFVAGLSAAALGPRGATPTTAAAGVWGPMIVMALTALLGFAARAFLLPTFLREMAQSLKDHLTADRCETFMKLMLVILGIYLASVLLGPLFPGSLALILLPAFLALVILGVIALVLYLMICSALRGDIADHRGRRGRCRSRP